MNYVVVTPAKNEEKFIRKTLDSMVSQSKLPLKWIIVDDGSTDNTLSILKEYENKYSWIGIVENHNKAESRVGGAKVVRAFNAGYEHVKDFKYDVIVKLDGDLSLPENYFEKIINEFKKDEKIGLAGGLILNMINGVPVQEGEIDYHVRGAFKAIRSDCFREIGGFKELWNWDGLDEMEAMRLGWKTKVVDLPVIHYRPTSGAYNPFKQQWRDGLDAFRLRSSLLLTLVRTAARLRKKPYILGSITYLIAYIYGVLTFQKSTISKELAVFMNRFHRKRLLGF
jgi:glycosyltransferase involved in cell wall biosynthesis